MLGADGILVGIGLKKREKRRRYRIGSPAVKNISRPGEIKDRARALLDTGLFAVIKEFGEKFL